LNLKDSGNGRSFFILIHNLAKNQQMRTIGFILLLAVIVALITVPGKSKFENYLIKKGKDTGKCLDSNSVRHYSNKLFSLDYVDYCEVVHIQNSPTNIGLAKKHTDTYLGLFGMFFKI
jgi:hypothetical protein